MSSEHLAYSRCSDVYLFSESMQARVAPQGLLSGLDEGCRRSAQHGCCSGIGPGGVGGGGPRGARAHASSRDFRTVRVLPGFSSSAVPLTPLGTRYKRRLVPRLELSRRSEICILGPRPRRRGRDSLTTLSGGACTGSGTGGGAKGEGARGRRSAPGSEG